MATGPEHYSRAEELVAEITRDDGSIDFGEGGEAYAAAAIVHALLALAAAAGLNDADGRVAGEAPLAPPGYRYVEGVDQPWVLERIIYDTHAAAYTETGHALCGSAEGPVSVDADDVDCGACMVALEQGPEVSD